MKAPFVFERLGWAASDKTSRFHQKTMKKRNGRNFWQQYMAWDAPSSGVGFFIWILLAVGLLFGVPYGLVAIGVLENSASQSEIRQAYHEVLHRDPDPTGMKAYDDSNISYESVKAALQNSEEKKEMDKAEKQ